MWDKFGKITAAVTALTVGLVALTVYFVEAVGHAITDDGLEYWGDED